MSPPRCRCSGDDAVNIGGSAAPLFRGCKLEAKRCGVRAFGSGGGRLEDCRIQECGEQGVKAMEQSHITLQRWARESTYSREMP